MELLDRNAWLYSAKTYAAAMIALFVGLACNLPRPYWAMATVYIVAQPLQSATHAKGIYRIGGTFIGCAAVLVLLPPLVNTPVLFSAVLSLWLAACMLLTLLRRGPRSYVFMLAGYTAAIIAFPSVESPDDIFMTAVARSEEIILGALVAVVVSGLVFPTSLRPVLSARIGNWLRDAAHWSRLALQGRGGDTPYNRLAADLTQFEGLVDSLGFDAARTPSSMEALERLRERLLMLLPMLAAISDRLGTLRELPQPLPEALGPLVDDIAEWLDAVPAPDPAGGAALRARIAVLQPGNTHALPDLLLSALLTRLGELIDIHEDCQALQHSLLAGAAMPALHYQGAATHGRERVRHVDRGMVLFAAASAGAALFSYCLLWIALGWQAGATGAMMTAVAASFFAAQDDPAPSMKMFLGWSLVAAIIAFVLLFGIIPAIHDAVPLVLVLAVVFLPLGVLMHQPRTTLIGLPIAVNLVMLLTLTNRYAADFQLFINSAVAMFIGMGFAVVLTRITRSVGAEWTARRLVRQGWATLAEAAEGRGEASRFAFAARMLDLLGLLAPRLAAAPEGSEVAAVDMVAEARVGLNILELRQARSVVDASQARVIDDVLQATAMHYRQQVRQGRALPAGERLLSLLDAALVRIAEGPAGKARESALLGVTGLRQSLYARS